MNDDKVRLKVVGLSYNPNQQGAYALILGELDGPLRIPVIIGAAEAQAIAFLIEGVRAPRPLSHDLMAAIFQAFDIQLKEVFIYKFEDGVFSSEILLESEVREVTIDCRTSDAVALAIRLHCPLTTTREVIKETGFVIRDEEGRDLGADPAADPSEEDDKEGDTDTPAADVPLEQLTDAQLDERMRRAIAEEHYEEAARISAILKSRKG